MGVFSRIFKMFSLKLFIIIVVLEVSSSAFTRPTVSPTGTVTTTVTTPTTTSGVTTDPTTEVTSTSNPPISTTSPSSGCSDKLSFSPGDTFPDSHMTCYDSTGVKVPHSAEDTLLSSGTSCIFMSSGHLTEGLVMEMYCKDNIWVVSIMHA